MENLKAKKYYWTVFMILCAVWAFWGCWKVKDLVIDNFDFLTLLNDTITRTVVQSLWYEKAVIGLGFVILFVFWITIPLQILWIHTIVTEKDRTTKEKIKGLTQDVTGQVFGMLVIISVWIGGVLLIAYFGGLLDLLWVLFLIGFILYSLTSRLFKRLTQFFKR